MMNLVTNVICLVSFVRRQMQTYEIQYKEFLVNFNGAGKLILLPLDRAVVLYLIDSDTVYP